MLPRPNPAIIFRSLAEGAVLFSTADEVYFGLNEVGAKIWELLPPVCATEEELCAELQATYPDADPEMIRADVAELLAELRANRLVLPADAAGDAGSTNAHATHNRTAERNGVA